MPRPGERTRSRKRTPKPLPGGKTGTQFKYEIAARPTCSRCGRQLAGVSNSSPKVRKLNRSGRRVQRVHGGQLCHECIKTALRQAARAL
ncbi:MAG: 50S ribosomal protein L34e [Candidatus Bathyarchaeia archaeon]